MTSFRGITNNSKESRQREHISLDDIIAQVEYSSSEEKFILVDMEEVRDPAPSESPDGMPTRSWLDVELEGLDIQDVMFGGWPSVEEAQEWLTQHGLEPDQLFAVRFSGYTPGRWRGFFEEPDESDWDYEVIGPVEDASAR